MKKKKDWVDFKEIKTRVKISTVLDRYGVKLKPSGQNQVSCCPIHKGSNPRQFSVSPEKNIWNCFGNCKAGGNVIDFVARMENVPLREAALLLKNWFLAGEPERSNRASEEPETGKTETAEKGKKLVRKENGAEDGKPDDERINPPLKFTLRTLTPDHPFFEERGILPETVKTFGLGLCTRGLMAGRIAIPIHDENGQLVAYCGRATTEEQIEEEGKYKLPPAFHKSEVVFNLWRAQEASRQGGKEGLDVLILVESFLSVFRLHQVRIPHAAALMGSSLSDRQAEIISGALSPEGKVILLFDADEDGERCAADCLLRLGKKHFVKWVDIRHLARKPHQIADKVIKKFLQ